MSAVLPIDRCRVCESRDLQALPALGTVPLFPGSSTTVGRTLCTHCGTLQTDGVPLPLKLFSQVADFDHSSITNHQELKQLAWRLAAQLQLSSSDLVLDVGSNDGTLLKAFQSLGTRTLGIEPSAARTAMAFEDHVRTLHGQFGPVIGGYVARQFGQARLIVSRFLPGVRPNLAEFLQSLAMLLEPTGNIVLQLRDASAVHRDLGGELVHTLAPCAFTARSLAKLAERQHLVLMEATEGPRFTASRYFTLRHASAAGQRTSFLDAEPELCWHSFANRWQRRCEELRDRVRTLQNAGVRVAGFGATPTAHALRHSARLETLALVPASVSQRFDVVLLLDRTQQAEAETWTRQHPPARLWIPFEDAYPVRHARVA